MAKVRVRALQRGYDGNVRREPGDEFDFDIEKHGQGRWFELVNEVPVAESKSRSSTTKKSSKKKSRKRRTSDDDLLI